MPGLTVAFVFLFFFIFLALQEIPGGTPGRAYCTFCVFLFVIFVFFGFVFHFSLYFPKEEKEGLPRKTKMRRKNEEKEGHGRPPKEDQDTKKKWRKWRPLKVSQAYPHDWRCPKHTRKTKPVAVVDITWILPFLVVGIFSHCRKFLYVVGSTAA